MICLIRLSTRKLKLLRKLNLNMSRSIKTKNLHQVELEKIRNIGVLAHIDAGRCSKRTRYTCKSKIFI